MSAGDGLMVLATVLAFVGILLAHAVDRGFEKISREAEHWRGFLERQEARDARAERLRDAWQRKP